MKYILSAIWGSLVASIIFVIQLFWTFSIRCAAKEFLEAWQHCTNFDAVCGPDEEYASSGRVTRFKDATVRTRYVYPKDRKKK